MTQLLNTNARPASGELFPKPQLTSDELAFYGQKLASLLARLDDLEARKQEFNLEYRAEKEAVQKGIDKLTAIIRDGSPKKRVEYGAEAEDDNE